MKCPRCGRENRRDAVVCWKCRASLVPSHEPVLTARRIPRGERVRQQKIPFKILGIIAGILLLLSLLGAAIYFLPAFIGRNFSSTSTPAPEPTTSEGETKQGEKVLKINVEAQEDKLTITGQTNLPEGTEIMLSLFDPQGNEKAKKKLTVIKSSFTHNFGPFLYTVYPGKYKVTAKEYKGELAAETTIYFKGNVEPYQVPQSQGYISFKEMSAAEGLKQAKTQNKLLLVLFVDYNPLVVIGGRTQNPSKYMEQSAFGDSEIRGIVNVYFVPMKVDASADKTLAQSYGVSVFPSLRVFNGEGELIGSINGYNSPDVLKKKLLTFLQTPPLILSRKT